MFTVRSGYNNRHRSVMCTAHALTLCTYSYVLLALRTVMVKMVPIGNVTFSG